MTSQSSTACPARRTAPAQCPDPHFAHSASAISIHRRLSLRDRRAERNRGLSRDLRSPRRKVEVERVHPSGYFTALKTQVDEPEVERSSEPTSRKGPQMGMFSGKKGLVLGVANDFSIAWAITRKLLDEGAEIGFTHLPGEKMERRVRKLVDPVGAKLARRLRRAEGRGRRPDLRPGAGRLSARSTSCCTRSPSPRSTTSNALT